MKFLKSLIVYLFFFNIIFSLSILDNGVEIFHINGDAQIGAYGGSNPSFIGINGKIFNNPALGNLVTNDIVSFTFRNHYSGIAKDHIFSTGIKQNFFNSLSIGVIYRQIEDIPNTLNAFYWDGNVLEPNYDLITTFNHWELATIFSISSNISDYQFGINLKTLMYSILNEKAYGIGFDAGLIHNLNNQIKIGIVLKNFPTMYIRWTTKREEIVLPQLGLGINYSKSKLNLGTGIQIDLSDKMKSKNLVFNSGIKYNILKDIDLIMGYNNQSSHSMGIEIKSQIFIINYSYIRSSRKTPFKSSHEMTLSFDMDEINKLSDYINP